MRRTIILSTTFATLLAFAQPAQADYVDDCNQSQDPDLRIGGCTALIRSGDYSGVQLGFAYNNRGIAYFDAGEYSQAIENYNRSLDFDPSDPDYYNNRGNAYSKLKQYARAIDDYDRSIRLDPGKAFAYNGRGAAYRHLGENALAIEDYSRALRIEPGYSKAYYNRGIAYDNLGRYRRAIADYDEAIRINPSYGSAHQNRGVSYENLGDFDRAARDWEQAIRVDGASRAEWWQNYMKERGHYSGAIDGVFGPATRRGLVACAYDPAC